MKSPLFGDNTELIQVLEPSEIAECWQSSMGVDVGAEFTSLPKIEYWHCKTTGLYWYSPPQAAGAGELYAQLERFDWYYMAEKWEFDTALRILGRDSRVLDVGVGSGYFLRAASMQGLIASGVELNPSAAARARAQGFEVFEVDLDVLSTQIEVPFDAVCAFQVLEHVPDPLVFLQGMISVLRPGGRLILSVPNAAVMRVIDPANRVLLNQPPHHMSHWDATVFKSLEEIFPVKVVQTLNEPLQQYHESWILTGLGRSKLGTMPLLLKKLLINRWSVLPLRALCRMGLRNVIAGHTLLVVLEHTP